MITLNIETKDLGVHQLDVIWEGKETLTTIPIRLVGEQMNRDTD